MDFPTIFLFGTLIVLSLLAVPIITAATNWEYRVITSMRNKYGPRATVAFAFAIIVLGLIFSITLLN